MKKLMARKQQTDPYINKNINGFTIIKFLGGGAEGLVYLGLSDLNKLYALKFTSKTDHELECLKKLCNKDTLCYFGDFDYNNQTVIITEFLEGYITLADYYENYSIIYSQPIKKRLCRGIKWIHSQNYIHGDINMYNILINPDTQNVKFIDFGKCKYTKSEKLKEKDMQRINAIVNKF